MFEMRDAVVTQKRYIKIIAHRHNPERVAQKTREKRILIDNDTIEKQLNAMQDYNRWKESIQMDIKCVAPFNVTIDRIRPEKSIRDSPKDRRHNHTHKNAVHKYHIQHEVDILIKSIQIQDIAQSYGR